MIDWQEPPAHVETVTTAKHLARVTFAVGSCTALNYVTFEETVHQVVGEFIDNSPDPDEADLAYLVAGEEIVDQRVQQMEAAKALDGSVIDSPLFAKMSDDLVMLCREASDAYPEIVVADGDELVTGAMVVEKAQDARSEP